MCSIVDYENSFIFSNSNLFNLLPHSTEAGAFRFNNYLNLRSSIRNSIVSYNAIQKVFRARFDEGRSNAKLLDFAGYAVKQPYLSSTRAPYEMLLGKNRESFFKINFYKSVSASLLNHNYGAMTSLNFYVFDFPFLLAFKSDASRYL